MRLLEALLFSAVAGVSWMAACGGKAIVDDPIGQGGQGGQGHSSSATATPQTSVTGPGTSCGTTDTCEAACSALFCCTQQDGRCPGIEASDEGDFVGDCVNLCDASPALRAVVDPADCNGTLETLFGLWADLDAACNGDTPEPGPAPGG